VPERTSAWIQDWKDEADRHRALARHLLVEEGVEAVPHLPVSDAAGPGRRTSCRPDVIGLVPDATS
jgi:hypothetical protein